MENTCFNVNLFKKNMLIPFQYYMKSFDDTFSMWVHQHNYFEIMYASSGSFEVEIAIAHSNKFESHKISQGQFIILKPNVDHRMVLNNNEKAFVYNMEFLLADSNNDLVKKTSSILNIDFYRLFTETKLNMLISNNVDFIIANDTSQFGTSMKELILASESKKSTLEDYINIINKELSLLTEMSICFSNRKIGEISYIRKANSYIIENYQRKITLSEIANHVGISLSYLKHQYKKHMDQTILGFINVLRVQKASKLLATTNLSIAKIAIEVGYKDKNQLNYEFKKIQGLTPSLYRKTSNERKIDFQNEKYFSKAVKPKF